MKTNNDFRQKVDDIFKNYSINSVLLKTFFGLAMLSVVPIVFIAFMFYNQSLRFWEGENYLTNKAEIVDVVKSVDDKIKSMERDAILLANNQQILSFMINPTFDEYIRNNLIIKNLINVSNGDNKADNIYVYSDFAGLIITSDGRGYTYKDFYDKEGLELYTSGYWNNQPFRRTLISNYGDEISCLTIIKNVPKSSNGNIGGIVSNIKISSLLNDISPGEHMKIGVFDEKGATLYGEEFSVSIKDRTDFLENVKNQDGAFVYNIDGSDHVILQAESPVTGWTFIGSVPIPQFYKESRGIAKTILGLSVIMLFVCLIVAFFVANKLYTPLKNLVSKMGPKSDVIFDPHINEYTFLENIYTDVVEENTGMAEIINSMKPTVKNALFLNLIMGVNTSETELNDKLDFIGEGFTKSGYGVIVIQIDNFEEFDEKLRNIYSYQLLVETKKAIKDYPLAIIKTDKSVWTVIINTGIEANKKMIMFASDIWEHISAEMDFTVTICVGNNYKNIFDLPRSYKEAEEILRFKQYRGISNVFDGKGNGDISDRKTYFINSKLIDNIIQSVKIGDLSGTQLAFELFVKNISKNASNYKDIYSSYAYLADKVIEVIIGCNIEPKQIFNEFDVYRKIKAAKSAQEINEISQELCTIAAKEIDKRNNERTSHNIDKMIEWIDCHLGEDISLTELAEYMNMSSAYVSRLFKEGLGVGFVEYLNTNRIKRAKILLEETQIMVDEVGFQVGFNTVRSFMRTFKQYEGTSPGRYRIEIREKNNS